MIRLRNLVWLIACLALPPAPAAEPRSQPETSARTVERWTVVEYTRTSAKTYANPFTDAHVDVVFRTGDKQWVVPAFWAGGQLWKVRFAPPFPGDYTCEFKCSDTGNADLNGTDRPLRVSAYTGRNPLLQHGFLRISADRRHFEHTDGTPFLWLADTWWKCLSRRMTWEGFQELTADRKAKGFNAVQIVCGPYPDENMMESRWENEGGMPYQNQDFSVVNPRYFEFADRRIQHLVEAGITPVIVGGWGRPQGGGRSTLQQVGLEGFKRHWRNLVARYGAYPTVWIVGGEARDDYGPWAELAKYVRDIDPYPHPLCYHAPAHPRQAIRDNGVFDFDMVAIGHEGFATAAESLKLMKSCQSQLPTRPVLCGEACYEGHMQTNFQDVQRHLFWTFMLSGAAGHTYGAAGIWQASVEGDPGITPVYDWTTWSEGMKYPGSSQLGLGKRFLERFPWSRFEVHPEWADTNCFAAGIPAEVRLVYLPKRNIYNWSGPLVKNLDPHLDWHAYYFDPATGRTFDRGILRAKAQPGDPAAPPVEFRSDVPSPQDWLLVLEKVGKQTASVPDGEREGGGGVTSHSQGLHGYIGFGHEKLPAQGGYTAGMGFYAAVWSLVDRPLADFQIGLPSSWIQPDNSDNKDKPLAPEGTLARTWKPRGPTWDSVFQTVEGGLGYWAGNHFRYGPPKFSMNSTPQCYDYEIGSPGWSFFYDNEALPDHRLGIAQLSNRLLIPPDALPFQGNPNGEFLGYSWMALPFTDPTTDDPPTGDQSWTCFLSAANFKGPIAYYIPETWSKIGKLFNYPFLYGRGLDARPGVMGGGAMEINTVPRFDAKDARGTTYSKLPKLQWPVDAQGRAYLVQDVTYYSKAALYDAFKSWRDGGSPCSGRFDEKGAFRPKLNTRTTRYDQEGKRMVGVEQAFDTRVFEGNVWGLQWFTNDIAATGMFPQYYRHVGEERVAVPAAQVPAETRLATQEFKLATMGVPYTSPVTGAWVNPGPKLGPFTAKLLDGSVVTYAWYRFVDQPSFRQYAWSAEKRARLQAFVEKLHANWPSDRDYMPPPSRGQLVALDPALLVKPPPGLELGYVPIVTHQAAAQGVTAGR